MTPTTANDPYVASQGPALGRCARIRITRDDNGTIWIGVGITTCVSGEVQL